MSDKKGRFVITLLFGRGSESEDCVVLVFTLQGKLSSKRALINHVDKMGREVVKCP